MPQATMTECPKCGAKVRKDKLRRHVSGVHGPSAKVAEPVEVASSRPASTVRFPWRAFAAMGVVALIVVGGYWYFSQQPGGSGPPPSTSRVAVMATNYGTIRITLSTGYGLNTVTHFIDLVTTGKYDGSSFSRIAWDASLSPQTIWVAQGGAASGVSGVAWEATPFKNVRYTLAMARSGDPNTQPTPDQTTSQFFINVKDNPALDPYDSTTGLGYQYAYVVFGHIDDAASRAVADTIGALYPSGRSSYDGPPTNPSGTTVAVTILSVTIAS